MNYETSTRVSKMVNEKTLDVIGRHLAIQISAAGDFGIAIDSLWFKTKQYFRGENEYLMERVWSSFVKSHNFEFSNSCGKINRKMLENNVLFGIPNDVKVFMPEYLKYSWLLLTEKTPGGDNITETDFRLLCYIVSFAGPVSENELRIGYIDKVTILLRNLIRYELVKVVRKIGTDDYEYIHKFYLPLDGYEVLEWKDIRNVILLE